MLIFDKTIRFGGFIARFTLMRLKSLDEWNRNGWKKNNTFQYKIRLCPNNINENDREVVIGMRYRYM